MSDRSITLFAFHSHGDVQFGPSSIPGVGSDRTEDESTASLESDEGGGSSNAVRVLLALGVLVAVAAAVRKFRGGDGETPEVPLAESDEIPATSD